MSRTQTRRPVEQRRHPRFPAWIVAVASSPKGNDTQVVVVADLSLGGAALHTQGARFPGQFELKLDWAGTGCEIHCETVATEKVWGKSLVHARFSALTNEQLDFLTVLITDLETRVNGSRTPA
jgi:hypothetical protein